MVRRKNHPRSRRRPPLERSPHQSGTFPIDVEDHGDEFVVTATVPRLRTQAFEVVAQQFPFIQKTFLAYIPDVNTKISRLESIQAHTG